MKPSQDSLRLGIAWCLVAGLATSLMIGVAGPASDDGVVQRLHRCERDELASAHVRVDVAGSHHGDPRLGRSGREPEHVPRQRGRDPCCVDDRDREAGADRSRRDHARNLEGGGQGEDGSHHVRPPGGLPRFLIRGRPSIRRDARRGDRRSRRHVSIRARCRRVGERLRRGHG